MAKSQAPVSTTGSQSRLTKFQLPKPVDSGAPTHTVKGEALLNSVVVVRAVGGRITAGLGLCRPVFFQFVEDYEEVGPIKGGAIKDDDGSWIANFPDDDDAGVYQFLLSETSPALKVCKTLMGEHMEMRGVGPGRLAVLRQQRSAANPGQSYYVLDKPQDGDLIAIRNEVFPAGLP